MNSPFENPLKTESTPALIVLPISDRCALVGERASECAAVNVHEINTASAELSQEFFVSSDNSEAQRQYQNVLGRRAALVTDDEVRRWFRQAFD